VHQYKLMEGIDDARFQLLAPYDEFTNTRALIQQVGRIVRNPDRRNEAAYVLDYSSGRQKSAWERYLKFDSLLAEERDTSDGRILIENCLKQWNLEGPTLTYFAGSFREVYSLEEHLDPDIDLLLPLTTNVYLQENGFSLSRLSKVFQAQL